MFLACAVGMMFRQRVNQACKKGGLLGIVGNVDIEEGAKVF